jgi:hypothetical protein
MKKVRTTILYVVVSVGTPVSAFAQSTDAASPAPVPSQTVPSDVTYIAIPPDASVSDLEASRRAVELERWMDDFAEWQEWATEWGNRTEPGWLSRSRDRRQKPEPPAWLADRCAAIFDEMDLLQPACLQLAEWKEDHLTAEERRARVVAATQQEEVHKTVWWEHIHMDLLWPATRAQSKAYGVVGIHTATTVRGRLQVFVAPGAMLVNLPARNGTRIWKVAANYGIGYRLFDFRFLGNRRAVLHLNAAKAWIVSDVSDVVTGRSMDFVGFSIGFNKSR